MRHIKKLTIFIVSFAVILSSIPLFSTAQTETEEQIGFASNNIHDNNYSRWANTVNSYLYEENGTVIRAEYSEQTHNVVFEKYNKSFELISSGSVDAELSLFGGFYSGTDYNYIVYGQKNLEDSETAEVVRIVQYTKDGKRVAAASVYGANTYKPFEAGSVRFAESDGKLYVYTCHEMFMSRDGLHHQANMLIIVDSSTMNITYNRCEISNYSKGYTSHSFNQFIAVDASTNSIMALDHGDAHPRSVVLFKYANQAGQSALNEPSHINLLDITGNTGDNITGVNVGGLCIAENNYLTVFSSIDQNEGLSETIQNVFVSVTPKNDFSESATKLVRLSDYQRTGNLTAGTPVITDIGNGKFLVMWEEKSIEEKIYYGSTYTTIGYNNTVYSVIIDENGDVVSPVKSSCGALSDCQPVKIDNNIVWYTTSDSAPIFFTIDTASDPEISIAKCGHVFTDEVIAQKTCTTDGQIHRKCDFCGYEYDEITEATGHIDEDEDHRCDICRNPIATDAGASASWDKTVYSKNDSTATVTVTCGNGVYIDDFQINLSYYSYSYTEKSITLYLSNFATGTYTVYLILSDNQVIETSFTISENAESTTEITTSPSTDAPTTEPSTDAPATEPSTDAPSENSPASWDKTVYTKDDSTATVTVACDNDVYITAFRIGASYDYDYWYTDTGITLYIAQFEAGTYHIDLMLSDDQIIQTSFTIIEDTESTTEPSTDAPATEPTTDIPVTEPTTDTPAAEIPTDSSETENQTTFVSNNIHDNNYSRWANTVNSYLYEENGAVIRAEYSEQTHSVVFEKYNKSFERISSKSVDAELSLFGGFYSGTDYNYIVYGQKNLEDSETAEVIRIVQYTKDGKRVAAASVYGANTYIPFEAGTLRFAESNGKLYVYTCHKMFMSRDGLHHQANMLIIVDTSTMNVTYNRCEVTYADTGYVSHSFNQFIAVDAATNSIIALDHGDAYPRSVVLFKFENQAGQAELDESSYINLLDITGETGNNTTGVNVGGLCVAENNYLTVFSSIDQNKGLSETIQNVFVSVTPKNDFSESATKLVRLSDYQRTENLTAGTPVITDIGNGKFLVMWEEKSFEEKISYGTAYKNIGYNNTVCSVIIDEDGEVVSPVKSSFGALSDCQPLKIDNNVVWYTTIDSAPIFFTIDTSSDPEISIAKCGHVFTDEVITQKTCTTDGQIHRKCDFCGYEYDEITEATGHIDENEDHRCDICYILIATDLGASASWDKTVYTKNDSAATVTVTCDDDVYIDNFQINLSYYSYSYTEKSITFYLSSFTTGTYTVYLILSDNQVIETSLTISEEAESTTEITTEPSTDAPTTEPSTDAPTTKPSTDVPATEPSTNEPTTKPSTDAPATEPSTNAPTTKPSTDAPATKPSTTDPTTKPATDSTTTPDHTPTTEPESETTNEPTTENDKRILGDMNGDGNVTAADARIVLRISAKIEKGSDEQLAAADVDKNGKVTAADARLILRFSAKLITSFK